MDRACHGPASRRATPPLERQRFWGYVGRVAHRWAMRKRCCGPSKSYERPGKAAFSTRNRKNRPRKDKGIRGSDARPISWAARPAQPALLTSCVAMLRSSSPLPSVGALTAGGTDRPGYRRSCRSHPCPRSARVAQRADAVGVLPHGLRPRLPMSTQAK